MSRPAAFEGALPRGRTLLDAQWTVRHRWTLAILWTHVAALPLLAVGHGAGPWRAAVLGLLVAAFPLAALGLRRRGRRPQALIVALGLLTCSALVAHVTDGAVAAHFHFLAVVAVLVLYEDWTTFLAAMAHVLLHHALAGAFARESVLAGPGDAWLWTGVHTFFIGALSVALVVTWRSAEALRAQQRQTALELERAHAALAAQVEDLERSNRELEQFACVASHDLGEPLRMVSSYLQLLDRQVELDGEAKRYLEFAVDASVRMRRLVDDLLRYSRAGRNALERRRVPAADVVAATMRDLAQAIEEAGATVEVDVLPEVEADPVLLAQVFSNLVSNAVKFHQDEPPRVVVSGRETRTGWEFAVQDNGIGVPPDKAERIFAMFGRLHHRERFPGTGIGLSVCQRIVERHGGRIHVEPAPHGRGSRFVFSLASDPSRSPG